MNKSLSRRQILAAGLGLALAAGTGVQAAAPASSYPDRPITIVVPYPAGGTTDSLARQLGNTLSEEWKQPVLVDNRPGASGMIGTTHVARSKPDGYTLLLTITSFIHAPVLYKDVQYDPLKDFIPLTLLTRTTPNLVVPADMPANTVQEYVELVKKDPARYGSMGNYGTGSMSHVYAVLLDKQAGLGVTHVPYKGAAQLTTDILGGQVAAGMSDTNTVLPHVKAGKLKFLAVTGEKRSPLLPDVPSLTELGYKDFESYGWLGLFAPAGTPADIVDKVSTTFVQLLQHKNLRASLRAVGIEPEQTGSQAEFASMVRRDAEAWARLIEQTGVKVE